MKKVNEIVTCRNKYNKLKILIVFFILQAKINVFIEIIPRIVVTRLSTERKKRIEKIKRRSLLKKRQRHARNETMSSECGAFEDFKVNKSEISEYH